MENLTHDRGSNTGKCTVTPAGGAPALSVRLLPRSMGAAACLAILAWAFTACSAPPATPSASFPTQTLPSDGHIHYVGRIDNRDPQHFTMSFPGSAMVVHFQGSGFDAQFSTTIADHLQVVIDGRASPAFAVTKEPAFYPIASGLPPGEHTAVIYKATETNRGTLAFYGLRLQPGTRLLRVPDAKRNIEFIGDSITAGYGDLGANEHEPVSPANSNWYFTYAAITARQLGAEQVTVAVSGIRLTQSGEWDAMPRVYRRVHSYDPAYLWDFKRGPMPDVVVINLSTNDFRHHPAIDKQGPPDEAEWTKTYEDFLDFVRSQRPSAEIYLADGPLMPPGPDLDHVQAWNREVLTQRVASGDTRCHVLSFPVQKGDDGYGSDFHPSVKTHAKMADQLIAAIRADKGW